MRFFLLCLALLVLYLTPPVSTHRTTPDADFDDPVIAPDEEQSSRHRRSQTPMALVHYDDDYFNEELNITEVEDEEEDEEEEERWSTWSYTDLYNHLEYTNYTTEVELKDKMKLERHNLEMTLAEQTKKEKAYNDSITNWKKLDEEAEPLDRDYLAKWAIFEKAKEEYEKADEKKTNATNYHKEEEDKLEELKKKIKAANDENRILQSHSRIQVKIEQLKEDGDAAQKKINDNKQKRDELEKSVGELKEKRDNAQKIREEAHAALMKEQGEITGCDMDPNEEGVCKSYRDAEKAEEKADKDYKEKNDELQKILTEDANQENIVKISKAEADRYGRVTEADKTRATEEYERLKALKPIFEENIKKAEKAKEEAEEVARDLDKQADQLQADAGERPENSKIPRKKADDAKLDIETARKAWEDMRERVEAARKQMEEAEEEYNEQHEECVEMIRVFEKRTIELDAAIAATQLMINTKRYAFGIIVGGVLLLLFCYMFGLCMFGQYHSGEFFWRRYHVQPRDHKYTKKELELAEKAEDDDGEKMRPFRWYNEFPTSLVSLMDINHKKRTFTYRYPPNLYGFDRVQRYVINKRMRRVERDGRQIRYLDQGTYEAAWTMPTPGRKCMDELLNARKIGERLERQKQRHRMKVVRDVDILENGEVVVERRLEPNEHYVHKKGHKHIRRPPLREVEKWLEKHHARHNHYKVEKEVARARRKERFKRRMALLRREQRTHTVGDYTHKYVKRARAKPGNKVNESKPAPMQKFDIEYYEDVVLKEMKHGQREERKDKRRMLRRKYIRLKAALKQFIKREIPGTINLYNEVEQVELEEEQVDWFVAKIKRWRLMLKYFAEEHQKRKRKNVKWVKWYNVRGDKLCRKRKNGKKGVKKHGKKPYDDTKVYGKRKKVLTKKVKKAKIDKEKRGARKAKKEDYKKLPKETRKAYNERKRLARHQKHKAALLSIANWKTLDLCRAFLRFTKHHKTDPAVRTARAEALRIAKQHVKRKRIAKGGDKRLPYPTRHTLPPSRPTADRGPHHTAHHKKITAHNAWHEDKKAQRIEDRKEREFAPIREARNHVYRMKNYEIALKNWKPPLPVPVKPVKADPPRKKRNKRRIKKHYERKAGKRYKKHHQKDHKRKLCVVFDEARIPSPPREPREDNTQGDHTELAPIVVMNEVVNAHEDPTQTRRNTTITQAPGTIMVDEGPPIREDRTQDKTQMLAPHPVPGPPAGVEAKSVEDKTQSTGEDAEKKPSPPREEKKDKSKSASAVFRV